MNYINFEVGINSYKLRLSTRNIVLLEKQLGCNPLSIFGTNGDTVPTITAMVAIFHAAAQQYNHGITLDKAYDIFDEYLAEGHSAIDFLPTILDIYRASGLIPKENKEAEEKNA